MCFSTFGARKYLFPAYYKKIKETHFKRVLNPGILLNGKSLQNFSSESGRKNQAGNRLLIGKNFCLENNQQAILSEWWLCFSNRFKDGNDYGKAGRFSSVYLDALALDAY